MVKLVDMPDLGSGAARRVGSSPIIRTKKASQSRSFFYFILFGFWDYSKFEYKKTRASLGLRFYKLLS